MLTEKIDSIFYFKRHYLDFFEGLKAEERLKFDWILKPMVEWDKPTVKFFNMAGPKGLYEIRLEVGADIFRVFCLVDKNASLILLNGFQEKPQTTLKNHLRLAKKLRKNYLAQQRWAEKLIWDYSVGKIDEKCAVEKLDNEYNAGNLDRKYVPDKFSLLFIDNKITHRLTSLTDHLDEQYGKMGSKPRSDFENGFELFKLGMMLQQFRKKGGMTRQQVALKCGTSKNCISKIETNASAVNLSTIMHVFRSLGGRTRLSIDWEP